MRPRRFQTKTSLKSSFIGSCRDSESSMVSESEDELPFHRTEAGRKIQKLQEQQDLIETQLKLTTLTKPLFDEFSFENKLREIVHSLVKPTALRVKEDRKAMDQINEEMAEIHKENENLKLRLEQTLSIKSDSLGKLNEIQRKFHEFQREFEGKLGATMTLASSFDEKLKTVQQKVELNIKLIK